MARNKSKKKPKRNPRKEQILATVTATHDNLSFIFDNKCNKVILPGCTVESIEQRSFYDKLSSKEKILNTTPAKGPSSHFSQKDQLIANFDFLFAVDTNTAPYQNKEISICVSLLIKQQLQLCQNGFPFDIFRVIAFDGVSSDTNPECIGWHFIINDICNHKVYDINHRIGIVVDSELDKLPKFNRHETPYYKNHFLPQNIQFIYASADRGKDFLPNKMIADCDKTSTKLFEYFNGHNISIPFKNSNDSSFKGFNYLPVKMQVDKNCNGIQVKCTNRSQRENRT